MYGTHSVKNTVEVLTGAEKALDVVIAVTTPGVDGIDIAAGMNTAGDAYQDFLNAVVEIEEIVPEIRDLQLEEAPLLAEPIIRVFSRLLLLVGVDWPENDTTTVGIDETLELLAGIENALDRIIAAKLKTKKGVEKVGAAFFSLLSVQRDLTKAARGVQNISGELQNLGTSELTRLIAGLVKIIAKLVKSGPTPANA